MAKEEKVLVFKREILEQAGAFQGLNFEVEPYINTIFAPGVLSFMDRSEAENNPNYKQIIPYVILAFEGKYLTYVRGKRAGETRLIGNRSIGIGGHINPIDDEVPLFDTDYRELYRCAVEREVAEEVLVESKHTDRIIALLNDDSNPVGRVHLGVVHFWTLDSRDVRKREQMITQMAFMSSQELEEAKDSMETWSRLCLEGLNKMEQHCISENISLFPD